MQALKIKPLTTVLIGIILLCGFAHSAAADVHYVKADSPSPDGSGLTWDTAFHTVQAAINAAASGNPGDQIWVAAGTYYERITLKDGVALYGGFAGTETALEQRNWRTNVTILDGQNGGTVVYISQLSSTTTLIDGFTIQNGSATDSGGGIDCLYSSATISNNTISGNKAANYGGGISFVYSDSVLISNNTINGNSATWGGGGIYCCFSSPVICNNIISGNNVSPSGYGGGGIGCFTSSPVISNNTFSGNSASYGGALYCFYTASPTAKNNIIAFNSSGIYADLGTDSRPTSSYNCFFGNTNGDYSGVSAGTGDIQKDPLFVDRANANFRLQLRSPCINAGFNGVTGIGTVDRDGVARIIGPAIDIGAYEWHLTAVLSTSAGTPTNKSPVSVTITFNNTVTATEFTLEDLRLGNGSAANFSGSGTSYSVDITPTSQGEVTVGISDGSVRDTAGNQIMGVVTLQVIYDTTAPAAPSVPDLASGSDTGVSNTDNVTADTTPTFTGTAETGSTVRLYAGTVEVGSGTVLNGNWSITSTGLADGVYTITAQATDAAGNTGPVSSGLTVTIDTLPPEPPSAPDMTDGSDSGVSNTDNLTATTTPTFSGTVIAGNTTRLYADGREVAAAITSGENWSMTTATALANGTHTITAKAVDPAGNISSDSAALTITIDTTPPGLTSITRMNPPVNAPTNAASVTYQVTFGENVIGVDMGDFTLTATGGVTGTITSISGGGATYNVTIDSIGGDGMLRLDLKASGTGISDWVGNAINKGYTAGQTYTIDNTAPTGSLSINGGSELTYDPAVTLTITADGTGSGLSQMRFSNDHQCWSDWEAFAASKSWTIGAGNAGTCTVYIVVQDIAGNTGEFCDIIAVKAAAPTFTPATGTYNTAVITMTCATPGTEIRYTDDGSEPTEASALYGGSPVLTGLNITARAFKTGWTPSDKTSTNFIFSSTTIICRPGDNDSPTSANRLQTAQNFRNDLSVQCNSAVLRLGKGRTGKLSDLWLYYPNIGSGTGQIPADARLISAKLVLTIKGFSGNQYLAHKINLYQITDPDNLGVPYFGESGLKKGLDYQYRDHRPGRNIPWKNATGGGSATISDLLNGSVPVDIYEVIPSVFQAEGYTQIRLDVTDSVKSWLKGDPNQGWFLSGDQAEQWAYDDGIEFYGATAANAANRPKLEVTYVSGSVDQTPPEAVTNQEAVVIGNQIQLYWTNPADDFNGVLILRKAGVIPAVPDDGTVVFDGNSASCIDSRGLTNDQVYYYSLFAYDSLRNYSKRVWVKAMPTLGGGAPVAPSGLMVSLSGNILIFDWSDNSSNENWFVIEQQEPAGAWQAIAHPSANQTNLSMRSDSMNIALKPSTAYQYRIKAVNTYGSSDYAPNIIGITTPAFPAAPTGLSWKIISAGRVNLSWTDMATNEYAYRVDLCLNDAVKTVVNSIDLPWDANAASVTGLTPGTEYLVKVFVINPAGTNAAWSDVIVTGADFKGGLL